MPAFRLAVPRRGRPGNGDVNQGIKQAEEPITSPRKARRGQGDSSKMGPHKHRVIVVVPSL